MKQHPPVVEDGDAVRESEEHLHVVLDDEQGQRRGQRRDHRLHRRGLLGAHSRRGLVEEQDLRLEREGKSDLELALGAVGEVSGHRVEDISESERDGPGLGGFVDLAVARERLPCDVGDPVCDGAGDGEVLAHREVREQVVALEAAGEAEACPPVGRGAGDVHPGQMHRAGAGHDLAGDDVEQGGLAGSVRADEPVALAGCELESDRIGHDERAERVGDRLGVEDRRAHSVTPAAPAAGPPRAGRLRAARP